MVRYIFINEKSSRVAPTTRNVVCVVASYVTPIVGIFIEGKRASNGRRGGEKSNIYDRLEERKKKCRVRKN